MIFSLAIKGLRARPLGTVCAVLVIALAAAMLFSVFSFGDAVYDYIYAVETADAGDSDILIAGKAGNRLADLTPLEALGDEIEKIVPTLTVYALEKDSGQYVKLRGFRRGEYELLSPIEVAEGDPNELGDPGGDNSVVISEAASEALGKGVGDRLVLGERTFFVAAVARASGYFLGDSPFTVIANIDGGVDSLLGGVAVYNEIYIKAAEGVDAETLRAEIAALPAYEGLAVTRSSDTGYVETRASGVSAPVTVAGAAVALMCVIAVALIFLLGADARRAYAAKLSLAGATRRQVIAVFALENAIIALMGALLGSAVSGGIFLLLLRLTLPGAVSFTLNGWLLFAGAATGGLVAFAASMFPVIRSFRSTARENLVGDGKTGGRAGLVIACAVTALAAALMAVENTVLGVGGVLGLIDLLLTVALAAMWTPIIVTALSRLMRRSSLPSVFTAGYAAREKRTVRSSVVLGAGMPVAMLLFVAWSLTTSVFTGYTAEFSDKVLVTNVPPSVDTSEFVTLAEGVEEAYLMVWRQAELTLDGRDAMTVNILGSTDALGLVDFGYVTPETEVRSALDAGGIVLDNMMSRLYGVAVGDTVTLTVDGAPAEFTVGGIVEHELFTGHYAILSRAALKQAFGLEADTVVLNVSGDAERAAANVRSVFAEYNYYAVSALEMYMWDLRALTGIFDLIGALAFILAALALVIATAGVVIGRGHGARSRAALMAAGMSKRTLLAAETAELGVQGLAAFAVSLPLSALGALCLTNALGLFGLYFGYMFEAWIAVAAGAAIALLFAAVPLVFGFRRHYDMRRSV